MSNIYFYKFIVNNQVFYKSQYTYALVNLKPLVPGHVLIVPLRTSVYNLADLTIHESIDYMNTLQLIHRFIKHVYKADSLNIAIQDGPESGQSIPHLHTHIIPRYKLDGHGDGIYSKLEQKDLLGDWSARRDSFMSSGGFSPVDDDQRVARTLDVMAKEALWLKDELARYTSSST